MLYVDMTFIGVCSFTYLLCIYINMTAFIYFKFYTKISVTLAVKDRFRFEAIIVNVFVRTSLIVAMTAIRIVCIIIKVVCIVIVDCTATGFTGCIVIIVTMLTKGYITVCCIFCPYTVTAAFAYNRKFIKTIGAKHFTAEISYIIFIKRSSAMGA